MHAQQETNRLSSGTIRYLLQFAAFWTVFILSFTQGEVVEAQARSFFGMSYQGTSYVEDATIDGYDVTTEMTAEGLAFHGIVVPEVFPVGFYTASSVFVPQSLTMTVDNVGLEGDLSVYDRLIGWSLLMGPGGWYSPNGALAVFAGVGPRILFLSGGYTEYLGYPYYEIIDYSFSTFVFGLGAEIGLQLFLADNIALYGGVTSAFDFHASTEYTLNYLTYTVSGATAGRQFGAFIGGGFTYRTE